MREKKEIKFVIRISFSVISIRLKYKTSNEIFLADTGLLRILKYDLAERVAMKMNYGSIERVVADRETQREKWLIERVFVLFSDTGDCRLEIFRV